MKAIWQISQFLVRVNPAIPRGGRGLASYEPIGPGLSRRRIAAHADDKGRLLGGKHSVRPIDKAGKRAKKLALLGIPPRSIVVRKVAGHAGEEASEQREAPRDRFWRHALHSLPVRGQRNGCARPSWDLEVEGKCEATWQCKFKVK